MDKILAISRSNDEEEEEEESLGLFETINADMAATFQLRGGVGLWCTCRAHYEEYELVLGVLSGAATSRSLHTDLNQPPVHWLVTSTPRVKGEKVREPD